MSCRIYREEPSGPSRETQPNILQDATSISMAARTFSHYRPSHSHSGPEQVFRALSILSSCCSPSPQPTNMLLLRLHVSSPYFISCTYPDKRAVGNLVDEGCYLARLLQFLQFSFFVLNLSAFSSTSSHSFYSFDRTARISPHRIRHERRTEGHRSVDYPNEAR